MNERVTLDMVRRRAFVQCGACLLRMEPEKVVTISHWLDQIGLTSKTSLVVQHRCICGTQTNASFDITGEQLP